MKTIVTHIRPHLDEVLAIWLLKRYLPDEYKDAKIEFIPTDEGGGKQADDPDRVCVGVGRGKFDEHKGDLGECAASLIFKYILDKGIKIDGLEIRGLAKLVDYVREGDIGLQHKRPYRTFAVQSILAYHRRASGQKDQGVMDLGFTLCDALLLSQMDLAQLEEDWSARTEFESIFGPAVAYTSSARDADAFAYQQGFDLVIYISKERNYHNIRAYAGANIDLSPIYMQLTQVEPSVGWYLHHSKRMLICGGELTEFAKTSKLTLEWIIDMLTPNYVRQQRY